MTNETQTTNPVKTQPRRWIRFRLRTLLVMVTLVSVPLGWVGWEMDQRRKEKGVVAWVENLGGEVQFHHEGSWWEQTKDNWLGGGVWRVDLYGTKDIDLSPLVALRNLRTIALYGTQVSDLSPLAKLKNLSKLELGATQVSDFSPLAELKNLNALGLSRTQVSDLSPLAELTSLELLDLRATEVSDPSPLAELKNLQWLNLSKTQVSDLSPLLDLKNLEFLDLSNTQVSEEQVQELRLALPNCNIKFLSTD